MRVPRKLDEPHTRAILFLRLAPRLPREEIPDHLIDAGAPLGRQFVRAVEDVVVDAEGYVFHCSHRICAAAVANKHRQRLLATMPPTIRVVEAGQALPY